MYLFGLMELFKKSRAGAVRWGRLVPLGSALWIALELFSTFAAIDRGEAWRSAQSFIDERVRYSSTSPEAPGAVPAWFGSRAGEPVPVFAPEGDTVAFLLVPVIGADGRVVSVLGLEPERGDWLWFSHLRPGAAWLPVGPDQARSVVFARRGWLPEAGTARLIAMPDKELYWRFFQPGLSPAGAVLVSVTDPSRVMLADDPQFEERRRLVDARGPEIPLEEAPAEPSAGIPLLFPPQFDIPGVPHHLQGTSYHCGPASVEMVFDFFGPDVNQTDIGNVADTKDWGTWWGSYADDNRRAVHFSSISSAVLDGNLHGYHERSVGYPAAENQWSYPNSSTDPDYPDRYSDLKNLVAAGYPVFVLTWYDATHRSGHFRVLKGYDDNTSDFIVHDPWYDPPYYGPNVHFKQTFFVDDLWTKFNRWALLAAPLRVDLTVPPAAQGCTAFTTAVKVGYPGPHPFNGQYPLETPEATIALPAGFTLAGGESATKPLTGLSTTGSSADVSWQVVAPAGGGSGTISVTSRGLVQGRSTSYPSYSDWIGGTGERAAPVVTPDSDCDGYEDPLDCGPADPAVHPGANELCNHADDDCDGTVDEGFPIPGPVTGLVLVADRQTLSWTAEPTAAAYDVVTGDLGRLLAAAGDFGVAVSGCLIHGTTQTQALDPDQPDFGNGFFYLVRAVRDCQNGTYDETGAGRQVPRDAAVARAEGACR